MFIARQAKDRRAPAERHLMGIWRSAGARGEGRILSYKHHAPTERGEISVLTEHFGYLIPFSITIMRNSESSITLKDLLSNILKVIQNLFSEPHRIRVFEVWNSFQENCNFGVPLYS